jgi:RNA polymerase sigma-70 factor (ECF subfamily)
MALYKTLSDQELLCLLKDGNKAAYTEIYTRYKSLLQNHAYKKLGDFEEVKDVLQELFTQLWVKRTELPETTNLSGYLYIAVRNKVFNIISHRNISSKYIQSLQEFIKEENYIIDLLIREKEFAEMIDREIDALPPKMREVFRLSRKAHLSHKEIAGKLDISEQTVSKQVTNALKILRVKLGAFFFVLFL